MAVEQVKKQAVNVHIRWLIRKDIPEVLQIEQEGSKFPWTENDFLCCLQKCNCIGMACERDEKVLGFMIYELHESKFHFLNLAVHPDWRRQSIGSQMVKKLTNKLSPLRRTWITIEVRETNLVAQLFFRKMEFTLNYEMPKTPQK